MKLWELIDRISKRRSLNKLRKYHLKRADQMEDYLTNLFLYGADSQEEEYESFKILSLEIEECLTAAKSIEMEIRSL